MKAYFATFYDGINPDKYVGVFSSPQSAANALNARRGREKGVPKIVRYDCTYGCKEGEIPVNFTRSAKAEPRVYYAVVGNGSVHGIFQYMETAKQRFNEIRKYFGVSQLQIWEGESLLMEYKIQRRWHELGAESQNIGDA